MVPTCKPVENLTSNMDYFWLLTTIYHQWWTIQVQAVLDVNSQENRSSWVPNPIDLSHQVTLSEKGGDVVVMFIVIRYVIM